MYSCNFIKYKLSFRKGWTEWIEVCLERYGIKFETIFLKIYIFTNYIINYITLKWDVFLAIYNFNRAEEPKLDPRLNFYLYGSLLIGCLQIPVRL